MEEELYIKSERGAPFHIHNCVFVKNSAANGGGLYVDTLNRTHIVNSVFTKNEADGVGGGLLVKYTSLTNCTLEGNSAAVGGAMSLINYGAISNSIIWGNSASLTNPGIHIREGVADNLFTQDPINANPLSINNCLIEVEGQVMRSMERQPPHQVLKILKIQLDPRSDLGDC